MELDWRSLGSFVRQRALRCYHSKPIQIAEDLFALRLVGVNVFLLGREELTLVDTGMKGDHAPILEAIKFLGRKPTDLKHILITHRHTDHTGGLQKLKQATGADVYMHSLGAAKIAMGDAYSPLEVHAPFPWKLPIQCLKFVAPRNVDPCDVDVRVEDGEVLGIEGGIQAIYTPGHCRGHVCYLWERHGGVLFAGDAISNMFGLGLSPLYEDIIEGKHSIRKLEKENFATICFGHGKELTHNAKARLERLSLD